jgi:hypothetical protein
MGILSYLKPAKGTKDDKKDAPAELKEKPSPVSGVSTPGGPPFGTPGSFTPGQGTPWGSRPASLYPSGEFRDSNMDMNELKCDVMVNWMYQQQMERLWTAGGHDEGVMLKRGRGQYTCCPSDISDEQYGFFKNVEMLNVKVCCRG